ncbi:MAG TPA: hypothetical protein VM489_16180 [Burkholderiales bacterium]|nr:hypothetical protein [Burkholderiales bacterium]
MPHSKATARKLLSPRERVLFDHSRGEALASLDRRRLRTRLESARRLRSKYRDLHRRQQLSARRRGAAEDESNRRTRAKEEIFADVVERLEKRLKKLDA